VTTIAKERALTDEEKKAWAKFVTAHREQLRAELMRPVFDDVRPAWEVQLEKEPPAPVEPPPLSPAAETIVALVRALFGDVRPAWQAFFAEMEHRAAA
jgi:hypothetical protein